MVTGSEAVSIVRAFVGAGHLPRATNVVCVRRTSRASETGGGIGGGVTVSEGLQGA